LHPSARPFIDTTHPQIGAATNIARTFDNTAQSTETGGAASVDH
jgi:hypothetical protein